MEVKMFSSRESISNKDDLKSYANFALVLICCFPFRV